jgi:hypothetical protein
VGSCWPFYRIGLPSRFANNTIDTSQASLPPWRCIVSSRLVSSRHPLYGTVRRDRDHSTIHCCLPSTINYTIPQHHSLRRATTTQQGSSSLSFTRCPSAPGACSIRSAHGWDASHPVAAYHRVRARNPYRRVAAACAAASCSWSSPFTWRLYSTVCYCHGRPALCTLLVALLCIVTYFVSPISASFAPGDRTRPRFVVARPGRSRRPVIVPPGRLACIIAERAAYLRVACCPVLRRAF